MSLRQWGHFKFTIYIFCINDDAPHQCTAMRIEQITYTSNMHVWHGCKGVWNSSCIYNKRLKCGSQSMAGPVPTISTIVFNRDFWG